MLLHREEERILTAFPADVLAVGVPWDTGLAERNRRGGIDDVLHVPAVGNGMSIRTVLEQQTNDVGMAGRPHQGSLSELFSSRVRPGSALQQQVHDVCLAQTCGEHQ